MEDSLDQMGDILDTVDNPVQEEAEDNLDCCSKEILEEVVHHEEDHAAAAVVLLDVEVVGHLVMVDLLDQQVLAGDPAGKEEVVPHFLEDLEGVHRVAHEWIHAWGALPGYHQADLPEEELELLEKQEDHYCYLKAGAAEENWLTLAGVVTWCLLMGFGLGMKSWVVAVVIYYWLDEVGPLLN